MWIKQSLQLFARVLTMKKMPPCIFVNMIYMYNVTKHSYGKILFQYIAIKMNYLVLVCVELEFLRVREAQV